MTSYREQNVSIIRQPGSQTWDLPATTFVHVESSARTPLRSDKSTKVFGQCSRTNSLTKASKLQEKDRIVKNKSLNFEFSSILSSVNRELSPVRWCDREVDGVYLGRSGWVQVQKPSLVDKQEDRIENSKVGNVSVSKSSNLNPCKVPDGKRDRNRPVNLPLAINRYPDRDRSFDFGRDFEFASSPSVTPIISPPPAFKDNGLDAEFARKSTRNFLWKDRENSPGSFSGHRTFSRSPSSANSNPEEPVPYLNSLRHRPTHTKSLEDDNRSSKWHSDHVEDPTLFACLRFRSLDNDSRSVNFLNSDYSSPSNFECLQNCDKWRVESEFKRNEYIERSRRSFQSSSCEKLIEDKSSRYLDRSVYDFEYRTRSSSVDSSSSNSSLENFDRVNPKLENSRSGKHYNVKRSRSLQLTEKESPCDMLTSSSCSGKSWDPMPPQPPSCQTRKQNSKCSGMFPQRLHHVFVTANGESIPVTASGNQSNSLNKITTSELEQKKLIMEAEEEVRIISEYLNKTRSRTAARNLLLHRYFNQPEESSSPEYLDTTATEACCSSSGDQNYQNKQPVFGEWGKKSRKQGSFDLRKYPVSGVFRASDRVSLEAFNFAHPSDHDILESEDSQGDRRSCLSFTDNKERRLKGKSHSLEHELESTTKSFYPSTQKQKPKNAKNQRKTDIDSKRFAKTQQLPEIGSRKVNSFEENFTVTSSSSSCSSVCQDEFLTKSEKRLPIKGYFRKHSLRANSCKEEVSCGRPVSALENDEIFYGGGDQKSLSLPRSFLSDRFAQNSSERKMFDQKQLSQDYLSVAEADEELCELTQGSKTAPSTPNRDVRYDRNTDSLNRTERLRTSFPSIINDSFNKEAPNALLSQKATSEKLEAANIKNKNAFLLSKTPLRIPENVLKKLRKNLSLKYLKGKGNFKMISEPVQQQSDSVPNEGLSTSTGNDFFENDDETPSRQLDPDFNLVQEKNTGNQMFRKETYGSYDSGIQMGNRANMDSSESQDTDMQEDADSPLAVRRLESRRNRSFDRELCPNNNLLLDKFKNDLQWRSKLRKRSCDGVRRTKSDLGGQRIFNWDVRSGRRSGFRPQGLRETRERCFQWTPSPEDIPMRARLGRPRLKRSLSQPLLLNEISDVGHGQKPSSLKSFVVSEDDKSSHGRNSENEFLSDSESSVTSTNERRRILECRRAKDSAILAEAVWDHVAIEPCELPFRAGDVIEVLDTRDQDWWWGATTQKCGYFPSAFVRLRVSQEDTVEDCLAAMAKGKRGSSQLRRGKSVSLLSNDQVRSSIVRELLNTERDFVKILRDVKEGYLDQCKRRTDMFTLSQISTIFSNIEDLLVFQEKFLRDLEAELDFDFPHKSCVGQVFLNHSSSFRIYSEYCNSHPLAIATLQDLYQNSNFCKFFEMCRLKQNLIEIPLDGYLLTPVQRICKYPLQLAELLKYTKPDHPDFKKVEQALETMRSVATMINERKRKMESLEKLAAWQERVEGWEGEDLIEISSQLIHQGEVVRINSGQLKTTNITIFLFDHQIIYCKKDLLKRNVFIYKGRVLLDDSVVIDLPDGKSQELGITVKYGLKINNKEKWFLFCCRSKEDKTKWLEAFAEERRIVTQNKNTDLDLPQSAKQLAKMSAKAKSSFAKSRGKNKLASTHEVIFMNRHSDSSKGSRSRKVGNWFTLGGGMKNSKVSLRAREKSLY